ncbi:MAG: aconitate hydratase, partial [Lentisphaerae bacterium]|nr:aconitate hydratase [Lentisphaerota bacterium]
TGTKNDECYLVSPETAIATALTGTLTDPRGLDMACPEWSMPERFITDDSMVVAPAAAGNSIEIIRKATIGDPPHCTAYPDVLDGSVLLKVGDKITTDHIMPAGTYLKLRSNIPNYAQVVFECFNEDGHPTFAERAAAVRDSGRHGVVVAGDSYGQGSSREHAAICPMHLGVRAVIARSIERIHSANLINFGILPLLFAGESDYAKIAADDDIRIEGIREQLRPDAPVLASVRSPDGQYWECTFRHDLSEADVEVILSGGRLSMFG